MKDFELDGVVSNCCGATVIESDICSDCKEHCEPISTETKYYYLYTKSGNNIEIEVVEYTKEELKTKQMELSRKVLSEKIDGWVLEEVGGDYSCESGDSIDTDNFDAYKRESCFINFIRYHKDCEPENIN